MHPDPELIALGVRQPWGELIVRGIKTVEVRSLDTRQRGTIYIYASKKLADVPPAREAAAKYGLDVDALPRGVLVGTVELCGSSPCTPADAAGACLPETHLQGRFAWRLENAPRLSEPLAVRFLPYGVWFYPFRRRGRA